MNKEYNKNGTEKKPGGFSIMPIDKFLLLVKRCPIFKLYKKSDAERNEESIRIFITIELNPDGSRPVMKKVNTDEIVGKCISIKVNEDNSMMILTPDKCMYMAEPYLTWKRRPVTPPKPKKKFIPKGKPSFNKTSKPKTYNKK